MTSVRSEPVRRQFGGDRAGVRDRARAPTDRRAWLLVGVIAAGSAAIRFASALDSPGPWIFPDELIYAELARSLAESGSFALRGEDASGAYNVVYPVLLAPAYALGDSLPEAYAASKAINAVVMSAAALPAYALARRLVAPPGAVVVAVLSILVPSVAYTATLMTENAFYPVFLLACLALVRHVEEPHLGRALVAAGLIAVAVLTRTQGVFLVPAALTAAAALDATARDGRWRRAAPLLAVTASVGAAALAAQLLRGGSALGLAGPYRAAVESAPPAGESLYWLMATIADLDLYLGVVPLAAWLALLFSLRGSTERERAFLVMTAVVVAWLAAEVAVFSAWTSEDRVMDRYAFYVAPFFFAALVAWFERPARASRAATVAAGAVAAALLVFVPLDLVGRSGSSDSLALLPVWTLRNQIGAGPLPLVLAAGALTAFGLLLLGRAGRPAVAVGAVTAYLAAAAFQVDHHFSRVSALARHGGLGTAGADWVDRRLPPGEQATVLVSDTKFASYPLWEHEFFNARLGRVYRLARHYAGDLPTHAASLDAATGLIRGRDGRPLRARYVLAVSSVRLAARRVGREVQSGATLYRVSGPVRTSSHVRGWYFDGWTGPRFTYAKPRCTGGRLVLRVRTSPELFAGGQTVTARSAAGVRRARVRPGAPTRLSVPLVARGSRCMARFSVAPARSPARRFSSSDSRLLGVILEDLRYVESRRPKTTGAAAARTASAKK